MPTKTNFSDASGAPSEMGGVLVYPIGPEEIGMIERWVKREILALARDTIRSAEPPCTYTEQAAILAEAFNQANAISMVTEGGPALQWFSSFEGMRELIWLSCRKGEDSPNREEVLGNLPTNIDELADIVNHIIDISDLFPDDDEPEKDGKKGGKKKKVRP